MNQGGEIPNRRPVVIGGVPVDNLTMLQALDQIEAFIDSRRPHQIATANVDFIVKAQDDPELLHILQQADLITADGMPLVWASRLLGAPLKGRVTGSDLVPMMAERGARKGWRFFFLGAAPGVAAKAAEILSARYSGLNVVGTFSPPNTTVVEMPIDVVFKIRECEPDIVLVAFGNPKQEKWIHMHLHSLEVPIAMGVGGSLDFITGAQRRAPGWMQSTGTEWIHRFLQDPKRMWRRYVIGLLRFILIFARQWWNQYRVSIFTEEGMGFPISEPLVKKGGNHDSRYQEMLLNIPNSLREETWKNLLKQVQAMLSSMQDSKPILILPMQAIKIIDPAGFGALLEITRQARAAGGDLRLEGIQANIRKTLKVLKLDRYLTLEETTVPADEMKFELSLHNKPGDPSGGRVLSLPLRIDVHFVEDLNRRIDLDTLQEENLVLDLSKSVYIDSAGIAWLASTSKRLHSLGSQVQIVGVNKELRRILQMSGYDHKIFSRMPDMTSQSEAAAL